MNINLNNREARFYHDKPKVDVRCADRFTAARYIREVRKPGERSYKVFVAAAERARQDMELLAECPRFCANMRIIRHALREASHRNDGLLDPS